MHCGRMGDDVEKGDGVAEGEKLVERNRGGIIICNVRYRSDKQAKRKEGEAETANKVYGIVVLFGSSELELEKIIQR
jgi:hypothetical protein